MSAPAREHHTIVIVGGGTAGLTTAARLIRAGQHDIAVVEPSSQHYYQPLFTVVGGGRAPQSASVRPESGLMPKGVRWIREAAVAADPDAQTVTTGQGRVIGYDYLVMAPGIQLDFGKVPGLTETLGKNGVSSNYRFDLTPRTWEFVRDMRGARRSSPCPPGRSSAPGPRRRSPTSPRTGGGTSTSWTRRGSSWCCRRLPMFSQPDWARVLEGVAAGYGIEVRKESQLTEVDGDARRAVIADTKAGTKETVDYDLLHAVPPQSAPDWVKDSPLADPAVPAGYVNADKHTLVHPGWPNVFTLGDVANLPTSKTGAAVRKQSPVLVANLITAMGGRPAAARYNGYTSCPLVTSRNRMLLAEFDYDLKPTPSIPLINTMKPRYDMWLLKRYGLPALYWHLMLRGRA